MKDVIVITLIIAILPAAFFWYSKISAGETFNATDMPPFSWILALIALFMLIENSGIIDKIRKKGKGQ